MATLSELRTRITEQVYDAPPFVTSAVVDRWINRAIRKLQERRNYAVMRAELTGNTTLATRTFAAKPSDWKQAHEDRPYYLRQRGDQVFMKWTVGLEDVRKEFTATATDDKGAPQALYMAKPTDKLGAQVIEVYPYPDGQSDWTSAPTGEYRLVVPYWKYLADLSGDSDANWFSNNAEDYIEFYGQSRAFRATWEASGYAAKAQQLLREEERDVWRKNVMEVLQGMTHLQPRTDVFAPRSNVRL